MSEPLHSKLQEKNESKWLHLITKNITLVCYALQCKMFHLDTHVVGLFCVVVVFLVFLI